MKAHSAIVSALALAATIAFTLPSTGQAQDVTLRLHHFLPPQAPVPTNFMQPWAEKIESESDGRISVELFPAMQLGGTPPQLYDQAADGVVDIAWTAPGYTPGRFPGTEVMELPFLPASAEATSQAAWDVYDKFLTEEFKDVQVLAVNTHGPGLLHVKGDGVERLEDMEGLKLRGPTRQANALIDSLGATPVGMPLPAAPEALSKGVIDGTVIPWEVTVPLKIAELVDSHTDFSGSRGLYTTFFVLAMNKERYETLPDELKAVIDANSGRETAKWIGRVMDEGDEPGRGIAKEAGNTIHVLDAQEAGRWKAASRPLIQAWVKEISAKGYDGQAMLDFAREAVARYAD